ncbi:MAG TPA: asparagine synthase (glutamine-hydrolyzing) [Pyrinomonadaceae bacterium]|nr:asparagine synthase (glutamine-hydrolyzing) [Pyrinomonadaceae bacterium]
MCGIAGFVVSDGRADAAGRAALLDRMCRRVAHRGPDDQGAEVRGRAALGMRRLSIIDVAGGHQPLSGCDPNLTIVFNGEIYNYRELRARLEARGHRFRTDSDTETIVHLYEEHGAACVEHLRGMFAFALWDARAEELLLARDRVGKKPLYYSLAPGGTLVFGSELKSLLEHAEVGREIDPRALDAYLTFGYVPDPLSILAGTSKLPPGHTLTFARGKVSLARYWDFPAGAVGDNNAREEDYLDELRALLDESVRVRLVAEVPLGAFLSGGVDSSAVVGLMARNSARPVKTFSIGFHEDSYSELKYARVAAKHFATDHHEFIVTPDICQVVDELAWHFDEPFADASAVPTYMVSKLARAHVTVALSGDGGDELFAGYTRYVVDRGRGKFARIPAFVRAGLMRPVSRALPHGAWGRNFLHNVSLDSVGRYLDSVSVFTALGRRSLYAPDFAARLDNIDAALADFRRHAARVPANGSRLERLLYLDSKTYLPGDILTKVDRMSMAVSLEARAPLLDHKLIEFVARIPASLKLKGTETKHIMKRAVEEFVPAEILRRPKMGFGMPLDRWINEQLRGRIRETLTEARARQRGHTNDAYVRRLLDEHERGRRDHSTQLWALFMLELWQRTFIDEDPARRPLPDAEGERAPVAVA